MTGDHIRAGEERWGLVAVAGILSFVAMLDMNIVNVALVDIADGLHVSAATAQWAVLGYQLPVVALLLPAGRRLDGVDTRSAVLAATTGFALCSALAAVSPWAAWLIAARLAQGACGAVLFVLMPVLAIRSVRPQHRGRAMSVPATLGPLGAVTGPAVGGLLLDHLGWPAVFLVKLPFCLLAVALVLKVPPTPDGPNARTTTPYPRSRPERRPAPDTLPGVPPRPLRKPPSDTLAGELPRRATPSPPGALTGEPRRPGTPSAPDALPDEVSRPGRHSVADVGLVAGGVAALLVALTLTADRPVRLLLALAAVPPLWWWLRGPGGRQVTGVLRVPGLLRAHGAVLASAAGFAAMHYVVALHLQRDTGADATVTGLTVLAFPLGMGLAGPLGGRLADRYGARPVAVAGAALTAAGLLLLVPLGTGWSPPDVAWRLALGGVGMGLTGGPVQALVMGAAPPERTATAGSTVQLARSLGFTLGPALATAAGSLVGPGGAVRAGLGLAAGAAVLAVPLLALPARHPDAGPDPTTGAAPAARP